MVKRFLLRFKHGFPVGFVSEDIQTKGSYLQPLISDEDHHAPHALPIFPNLLSVEGRPLFSLPSPGFYGG